MAVSMKVTVFWEDFSLEDRYQNSPIFRVDNLKMEALGSFETQVSIYQSTWYNIPEDCTVHSEYIVRGWFESVVGQISLWAGFRHPYPI